jgi:hypothetical protein
MNYGPSHTMKHRTKLVFCAFSLVMLAGTLAHGQTALGNGRGLEADLSGRGIGNAPRADFMREVRLRNDVVTGNAVGGRSFRGNVGYRAADEFRGSLGSDDLFSFRRDSITTGQSGTGLRGTGSLQYQYSFSTGNQFGSSLSRSGGGTQDDKTQLPIDRSPRRVTNDTGQGLGEGWNTLAPKMGTLRSTSTYNTLSSLNPSVIGARQTRDGIESLTASSLLGLRAVERKRDSTELPPGLVNPPVRTPNVNTPVPTTPTNVPEGLEQSVRPGTAPSGVAPAQEATTAYSQIAQRYKSLQKPDDVDQNSWEERMVAIRKQLQEARENRDLNTDRKSSLTSNKGDESPKLMTAQEQAKGTAQGGASKTSDRSTNLIQLDAVTIDLIRAAGGEVSSYALTSVEQDLYSKYMTQGSAALAAGRYFDAEENFARSLSISPGDPSASAARLNAQLGAALFLSAAVNLEELLQKHPEMATTRYTNDTMPSPARLASIVTLLRDRVAKDVSIGVMPPRDASLLLAYVGFQTQNNALTAEGLDLLDKAVAGAPASSSGGDALCTLLRALWLPK